MHDYQGMTALRSVMTSPPLARDFHTTVIKRAYDSSENKRQKCSRTDHELDEEDFSDHDSHYSDDFDELGDNFVEYDVSQTDIADQLLNFAERVNGDIRKFFGRRRGDDDSCDIYQDKWISTKSGRELYYADLLRIAKGEGIENSKSHNSARMHKSEVSGVNDHHSGRMDQSVGLGPLSDLFEYGLRHFLIDKTHKCRKIKRLKTDAKKFEDSIPMQQRKFPSSFWREPQNGHSQSRFLPVHPNISHSSRPPDFSDLLHSWTAEVNEDDLGVNGSDNLNIISHQPTTKH